MRRTARLVTGAAVLGVVGITGAPAALAQTVDCAVYPDACVRSEVIGDSTTRGGGAAGGGAPEKAGVDAQGTGVAGTVSSRGSTPSTLPFTGGESVLLGLAGAGAVAAGTVLVVAARRRGVTAA